MPRPSNNSGMHYLGVAPVEFDGRGKAIIARQHLRFAPEFGGHSMSNFQGNPEGLLNTGGDFDDADIIEFGDDSGGWTYYDSLGGVPSMDDVYAESLGNIPSMDDVYAESLGDIPSMDDVYAESLGRRGPRPLSPRQARPYLRGKVRSKRNWQNYVVYVIAPNKQAAKAAAKFVLSSKRNYRGKFETTARNYIVSGPKGVIPSPGVLPWAPQIPMPPPLVPIPVWQVKVKKKGASAPRPGTSAAVAPLTTVVDRMVAERRAPTADRGRVARVSDWQQLSAEQQAAIDDGIPQNLPVKGLTYPGGEGDSYFPGGSDASRWEEEGVNQDRYDAAVAALLADEFGSALPYGTSDTDADIAPVDLLAEEVAIWDAAFGGDVYDEGSGILYDGYQDSAPMTAAELHALADPADVNFGADPYSNYFGRGCGC